MIGFCIVRGARDSPGSASRARFKLVARCKRVRERKRTQRTRRQAGRKREKRMTRPREGDSGPRGRDGEEQADAASANITKPPGYDSLALLLSFASLLIPPDSAPLSSLTGAPWRATKNCGDPPAGPPPLPARR